MEFLKRKQEKQVVAESGTNNPYLSAKEEWLERYGSYIGQAAQWRTVACVALLLLALSLFGNIMQSNQAKVVPYIIEVDNLGKTNNVFRADRSIITPKNIIQAEIADVIINWRTVTADTALQKQMITRLSRLITGSAKGVLQQWYTDNSPYEIAKNGNLIHVEISGLPLPVSDTSYRVEWLETIRNHTGALMSQQRYQATVAIQLQPPTTEADIMVNPGGVYVTALAVSKILSNEG